MSRSHRRRAAPPRRAPTGTDGRSRSPMSPRAACRRRGRRRRGRRTRRPRRPRAARRRPGRRRDPCRSRRGRTPRPRGDGRFGFGDRARWIPLPGEIAGSGREGLGLQHVEARRVAGAEHVPEDRGIEEASGHPPGLDAPPNQLEGLGRYGLGAACLAVEPAELAGGLEPTPQLFEPVDPGPGPRREVGGAADHEHGGLAAHGGERLSSHGST